MIDKMVNEILFFSKENYDTNIHKENKFDLLEFYSPLSKASKFEFLHKLGDIFNNDETKYEHSFEAIGQTNEGIKFLLNLREDILLIRQCVSDNNFTQTGIDDDSNKPHRVQLADLDNIYLINETIKKLFREWFNFDSCQLHRITSKSSKHILQRICHLEAVHPPIDLRDMKRRVGPYRRCYIFTHVLIPEEPIAILHCALSSSISASIQEIINSNHHQQEENPFSIKACTFYSISSTKKGLSGIGIGATMIQSALTELQLEFPIMKQFSTLSPIPNFRKWLTLELSQILALNRLFSSVQINKLKLIFQVKKQDEIILRLQTVLDSTGENWELVKRYYEIVSWFLRTIAAKYLYGEKNKGYASDPVCHFHLKNGAIIHRINWLADSSTNGIKNSYGVMVNYKYEVENIDNYRHQYRENKIIHLSDGIEKLLQNDQIINID